jgi:Tol biopolymer transport system component
MKTLNIEHVLLKVNFVILGLFLLFFLSCKDKDDYTNPNQYRNGQIAFASDRDGNKRIFVMDYDGKNQRRVTDDAVIHAKGEQYYSPSFSVDAGRIAFIVYPEGSPASVQFGIGTVSVDGSGKKLLGSGVPDLQYISQISAPSWDQPGNVFFAAGDPNSLYYYKHDNGGILRVDANWCYPLNGFGCWQSLSPAAVQLGLDYNVILGVDSKIVKVNYMTGAVETLFEFGKNHTPSYNPCSENQIVTSNGTDIFKITTGGGSGNIIFQLTKNSGRNTDPVFSPDGLYIAFTSYRDGNGEIYVMNNDGSSQTNITNNPGNDYGPSWANKRNK